MLLEEISWKQAWYVVIRPTCQREAHEVLLLSRNLIDHLFLLLFMFIQSLFCRLGGFFRFFRFASALFHYWLLSLLCQLLNFLAAFFTEPHLVFWVWFFGVYRWWRWSLKLSLIPGCHFKLKVGAKMDVRYYSKLLWLPVRRPFWILFQS